MDFNRQQLGGKLKKARLQARIKQEQVARYLELPVSAISAIESGNRKVEATELFLLSKLYQLDMEWFFTCNKTTPPGYQDISHADDPLIAECVLLLKKAPHKLQRSAAYGLIGFLSER